MERAEKHKICFVVLSYFSYRKVADLLRSIGPTEAVCGIIVDNSNDDEEYSNLLEVTKHREDVMCIQSDRNGGFSYGTNLGIHRAIEIADSVLILNPDTTVEPNFFPRLIAARDALPDAAITPHGIVMSTGETWSAGGRFHPLRGRADVQKAIRRSGETSFGTCACLLVPADAIRDIGFLDEDFFLGGEEWDYSRRLRASKWPIIYLKSAQYQHEISGTHEKYGPRFFYVGMRTKTLYARKHYGPLFWLWLLVAYFPSGPLLIYRNGKRGHGNLRELTVSYIKAAVRSVRRRPITEIEFLTAGKSFPD